MAGAVALQSTGKFVSVCTLLLDFEAFITGSGG